MITNWLYGCGILDRLTQLNEESIWIYCSGFNNGDGGWEHSYVIIIDTLDNPGWCVRIDLVGTELEGRTFDRIENLDIDDDWMVCEVKNRKFIGSGDPSKLVKILQVFRDWVEN